MEFYTPTELENKIYNYFERNRKKNEKLLKELELEIKCIAAVSGYEYNEKLDRLQVEHEKIVRMNKAMNGF